MADFTHLIEGKAVMVDVTTKAASERTAKAMAVVQTKDVMIHQELSLKAQQELECVIKIAAIQAAKKTSDLIPFCHPLALTYMDCNVQFEKNRIVIECTVKANGTTGVEMEALVGANIGALAAYDMIKSKCKGAEIENVSLLYKEGGKSGVWKRPSKAM